MEIFCQNITWDLLFNKKYLDLLGHHFSSCLLELHFFYFFFLILDIIFWNNYLFYNNLNIIICSQSSNPILHVVKFFFNLSYLIPEINSSCKLINSLLQSTIQFYFRTPISGFPDVDLLYFGHKMLKNFITSACSIYDLITPNTTSISKLNM